MSQSGMVKPIAKNKRPEPLPRVRVTGAIEHGGVYGVRSIEALIAFNLDAFGPHRCTMCKIRTGMIRRPRTQAEFCFGEGSK